MNRTMTLKIFALLGLAVLGAAGCGEKALFSGTGFDECTPGAFSEEGGACAPGDGFAQFCSTGSLGNSCLNVCNDATLAGPANGNEGDSCELDSQCDAGLTCDNDAVGSSSCRCEPGTSNEQPEPTPIPTPDGECPNVVVDPGTVPFGGACDADADCQDGLPCIDCSCV